MAALDRPAVKPRPVYLNLLAIRLPLPGVRLDPAPRLRRAAVPRRHSAPAVGGPARAGLARRLGADARHAVARRSPSSCWSCSPGRISITSSRASAISDGPAHRHGLEVRPAVVGGHAGARRAPDARRRGEAMVMPNAHRRRRPLRVARLARAAGERRGHGAVHAARAVPLLWHGGLDYAAWKATFASELFRLATFVFMLSLLWHAWVGVRNIAMDYLKPVGVRLTFEVVVIALAGGLRRLDHSDALGRGGPDRARPQ